MSEHLLRRFLRLSQELLLFQREPEADREDRLSCAQSEDLSDEFECLPHPFVVEALVMRRS